jgi:hypothetical protein
MLGNYFYHEILKRTLISFATLFNDIYIKHKDSTGNIISEIKVPIRYGPIQKFLARIEEQPELNKPVAITLPRLSFEMTSLQYDPTRKANVTQTFCAHDGNNFKKVYMPIPYNIGFQLNLMCKLQDDAFQVTEQIIPFFQPSFNLTVDLIDSIGEKRDIPIILDDISFTDDYEGDFNTRRILIYTYNFTVKTYFFGPIADSTEGLIKKVQVDLYSGADTATSKRELRYTAVPNPIDAGPDDNYGIDETWDFFNDSKSYSPTQQLDI